MSDGNSGMSAEALKLVELTKSGAEQFGDRGFSKIDVTKVLQDHPELMAGLNEYLAWRDDENKAIGETTQVAPVTHSVQETLRNLQKKKKKKGK